jgi:hypothetical protein
MYDVFRSEFVDVIADDVRSRDVQAMRACRLSSPYAAVSRTGLTSNDAVAARLGGGRLFLCPILFVSEE